MLSLIDRIQDGRSGRVSHKRPPHFLTVLIALCAMLQTGCSSIRVTDPPRTATEQFLLSTAAQKAVSQLNFEALQGRNVFLDTQYFAASEQAFVIGELRARLLLRGVRLHPNAEEAEIIMEVRSGGVGIDREDTLVGLPSVPLSAGSDDSGGIDIPFATPEISLLKNIDQLGVASVAFVAYWKNTGEVVATSGPYIGTSYRDDWWFFGFGPNSVGNIAPVRAEEQ